MIVCSPWSVLVLVFVKTEVFEPCHRHHADHDAQDADAQSEEDELGGRVAVVGQAVLLGRPVGDAARPAPLRQPVLDQGPVQPVLLLSQRRDLGHIVTTLNFKILK